MSNLTDWLQRSKALETSLPTELAQKMGSFPFSERLHTIEQDGQRILVKFFSDGLALNEKSLVENMVRNALQIASHDVIVLFERKEKAPSNPQQAPQPARPAGNSAENPAEKKPSAQKPIPGVKHILAVASGKGGVGKSTVSVNLALALHNQGYKVGILDADIYGPSVPTMLNIHKDPSLNDNNKIDPPMAYGLKVMSFGFFAPEDTAVIWRGPMIMKALQQFFWDVDWGELDFLVIDLPPGTGDAQLTLVQSIPIAGAVIVTTPQNVALLDAVKGIAMFQKTNVPVLGVVENMSYFACPSCGSESFIFGSGGAQRVSERFSVDLLGQIPLVAELRVAGDVGEPLTSVPGHSVRLCFAEIAERVVKRVFDLKKTT